jgi:hypothetical protein
MPILSGAQSAWIIFPAILLVSISGGARTLEISQHRANAMSAMPVSEWLPDELSELRQPLIADVHKR